MTASAADSQRQVLDLLADPATHGHPEHGVGRRDTHAASVFLAGERAYKLKLAVAYPFLDFSTLDKRAAACAEELRLNRRTAPSLYLGVCPVIRGADGGHHLGALQPDGPDATRAAREVVDWVVVMRRFPQDALLAERAAAGALDAATAARLADTVGAMHDAATPLERAFADAVAGIIDGNAASFAAHRDVFERDAADGLTDACRAELARRRQVLDARAAAGRVRRCHGDLHLGNIVLLEGVPTPFDAVEFNAELAEIDTLYDLAFLLMDLAERGLGAHANRVLTRYLDRRDEPEGLASLPLFLALRAAIRAKVTASAAAGRAEAEARERGRDQARAYMRAARGYLTPPPPRLVAVGGVSGTGKTTLARAVAPEVGAAPGALVVRSDVERKRLFGVAETEALPEDAYTGAVNARVYRRVLERARRALEAGHSAVVEATFLSRDDRARARKTAEAAGVAFDGLWLSAPAETLRTRVAARSADASDATPAVVDAQLAKAPGGEPAWPVLDAGGAPEAVHAAARRALGVEESR